MHNRFFQNTSHSMHQTAALLVFLHHFPKFSSLIHHDVLDHLSHSPDISNLCQFSNFGTRHDVQDQLPLRDASACSPILTRLSWIPSTSVVLVLIAILSVRSVRLVAPFLCLFLAAPTKPVRQPLHLLVPHQHVQVWAPAVLPLHHVVAAIPRIACECHRILQRRSHFFSPISPFQTCGFATRPSRAALHPAHPCIRAIVLLRLVECRIVSEWFLDLTVWEFVEAPLPLARCERFVLQHARLSSKSGKRSCNRIRKFRITGWDGGNLLEAVYFEHTTCRSNQQHVASLHLFKKGFQCLIGFRFFFCVALLRSACAWLILRIPAIFHRHGFPRGNSYAVLMSLAVLWDLFRSCAAYSIASAPCVYRAVSLGDVPDTHGPMISPCSEPPRWLVRQLHAAEIPQRHSLRRSHQPAQLLLSNS